MVMLVILQVHPIDFKLGDILQRPLEMQCLVWKGLDESNPYLTMSAMKRSTLLSLFTSVWAFPLFEFHCKFNRNYITAE